MRTRHFLPYAVTLLGLLLGLWGAHNQMRLSALPDGFDAGTLRFPVQVNGQTIASPDELQFCLQSLRTGDSVRLVDAAGTHAVTLTRQLNPFQRLVTIIGGLFFLAVTFLVFCPRFDRKGVRVFFWAALLFGIAILIGGIARPAGPLWPDALLSLIWILALSFLPLLFVHMSLSFPRRRALLDRAPLLEPLLLAISLVLFVAQSVATLYYLYLPSSTAWATFERTRLLAQIYLVAAIAAGCIALFSSSRQLELTRERQQTKWLLWGFTLGVTPYVFLRTVPRLLGLTAPMGVGFDRILELAIPIAFTFAVVRYKFLDIDIIIRRSLIYTILAALMVGLYILLAVLLGRWVRVRVPGAAPYIPFVAAAVPVALFEPTRRTLGRWVDRTFFKIRYSHDQALRALQQALPAAAGQDELLQELADPIERHLQPKRLEILLRAGDEPPDTEAATDARHVRWVAALDGIASLPPRSVASPGATSLPEIERAEFPEELQREGIQLAVPLSAHAAPVGWMLLGEKQTERRYIEEDLRLLEGAATEATIALERIRLVQRVAEEGSARRRLDEIDRLKSDFLSRVAHDLRTPITSIGWSTQNLLDGLAGAPTEPQREVLETVRTSTQQMQRLVNNLLEISRLELSTSRVQLGPVDLAAVVGETIRGLKPLAARRGIGLELHSDGGLPPVCGDRDKLFEVAANLIDNAIKYAPANTAVEIALTSDDPDRVRLDVRDHGPGIADGESEIIFDRFRQGRPSPHAETSGFGLGLYVVHSFLAAMGGTVRVENHPQGGARFTCTLARWTEGRA
jgi:signal transduction histidine kinase